MSEYELASARRPEIKDFLLEQWPRARAPLNLKAMHEGNTLILYYLTVEKPMVMNTRGRPMPMYNTR